MSTLIVSGTVTNEDGAVRQFSGTLEVVDPPVIDSVVVEPASAPAGVLRTITVTAHDPSDQDLTYTCKVNGVDATPVEGSPGVFTFQA